MYTKKMLKLSFYAICALFTVKNCVICSQENCLFLDDQTNTSWKLVFEENFNSPSSMEANWRIDVDSCTRWFNQKSCNSPGNVHLADGYLIMNIKRENRMKFNYTGALLTSARMFPRGRIEMRAIQPDAGSYVRTGFYARRWQLSEGQLTIAELEGPDVISREAYSRQNFKKEMPREKGTVIERNMFGFHRYGVVWNSSEGVFYLDDQFGEPWLLNANRSIQSPQEILLWHGIQDAKDNILYDASTWKCPAFIIDYVRVFEPVESTNESLVKCVFEEPAVWSRNTSEYRKYCQIAKLASMSSSNEKVVGLGAVSLWIYLLIGSATLLILSMAFICFQQKQIGAMKKKINKSDSEFNSSAYYHSPKFETYEDPNYLAITEN